MKNLSFIAAALCLLAASNLGATEQMRSGEWRVVKKADAQPCKSAAISDEKWPSLKKEAGKQIITVYPPNGSAGEPAKFVVMFGSAEVSDDWTADADQVAKWWNCEGEGQFDWYIEMAPDVREIVDPNVGGTFKMWICMEAVDGKRYAWYGDSPFQTKLNETNGANLNPGRIQLPADYRWDGVTSSAPGAAKDKPFATGETRLVTKDKAPAYQGFVHAFDGWEWIPVQVSAGKVIISWPGNGADACGGDVVKYLVYFGHKTDGNGWYPKPSATQKWFECKGSGQWSWYLECAPDVRQIVDENEGAYVAFVAVEFASGKRVPLYGELNATSKDYSADAVNSNAFHLPKDYKAGGEPTPTVEAGKPVWQELGGAVRTTGDLKAGQYRIISKADVPEWKGDLWSADKWRGSWVTRRQSLVNWPTAADDGDNKCVKFIVLVSTEFKNSPSWHLDAQKVKDWMECKGENQAAWIIECAPDVTQILDLNRHLSYYIWVLAEYSDGKRYPWFKEGGSDGYPGVEGYDDSKKGKVRDTCLKMYQNHEWAGQLRNKPEIESGKYRIITKDNAKPWTGELWTSDRFYGKNKTSGRKDMFSWPTAADDEWGNKAVKFIVYFGKRDTQTKWHTDASNVKKWFSQQGQAREDGAQYDWCIECAADVTQLVDTNADSNYNFWVVVEWSNGGRSPWYNTDFPTQESYNADKLRKNRIEISVTETAPKKKDE
ncbi:MAG: hypothetical protein IT462_10960 [Planctomycetes bacterium]|nr:hypothetical protein [Planctomycetota bacterium]